ncbi:alpha/beta hydrolase [uncultured Oxalicibacterium sp.]|uniref:RBBP9/YdeN family alpha/beta hydrolase n=1 Tax=uncultured Oxalicibacterium sp. TaxID=1168540 RepID=UPI0025F80E9D|nr:alpha/beta hydrolase [uncultured Oxalicibacterium sp.]
MIATYHDERVLVVPGLHGSGPAHWQSRWEALHPSFERVEQDAWDEPDLLRWSARLQQRLQESDRPTLLIAHSFGCLTAVHASLRYGTASPVVGALLVAPADPHKFGVAQVLRDARLPFPAVVIGSTNDPWMHAARASYWADAWACGFVNAGTLGHINADSSLGDWPQGWQQFEQVRSMARLLARPPVQQAQAGIFM